MNAASSGPPAGKHWTFADLMQFDETDLYEIYDGRLIPIHRPLPGFYHQLISGQLLRLLDAFIRPRALGKLLIGPLDVIMAEDNTAEPDLLFIARENAGIAQDWIRGTPDLIVEIISPSTIVRDRYDKLEQYARFGVKEYWIVDPANQSLEILALNEKRFVMHSFAAETGKAESRLLPGLTVDLAELFEPEDREVFWGERPPVRRAESPST
ncbi:protein of unknown function DUF820 [Chthoniobacter flavus Ellin428]|uniref:Putative restriction endonuclease domain-containing protein n=3 Tax=Chthoniobacter flavus TaxID=191863 RepID=B4D227_9BACT|nr:protein of unknown function DUF820 [Chthoniobacter flavus Ellin428]TCO82878.1 Uma2 family endonuclease [Chthoniobacter flavus]